MVYHNDGVFGHDEVVWGEHLVNFEADHGEVIGIYGDRNCASLKTLNEIAENHKMKATEGYWFWDVWLSNYTKAAGFAINFNTFPCLRL